MRFHELKLGWALCAHVHSVVSHWFSTEKQEKSHSGVCEINVPTDARPMVYIPITPHPQISMLKHATAHTAQKGTFISQPGTLPHHGLRNIEIWGRGGLVLEPAPV